METSTIKRTPFSDKLIKLRGKKTRAEVAAAIGVSESSYTKYERGERTPCDATKEKLAAYFGKTVGFIFFS